MYLKNFVCVCICPRVCACICAQKIKCPDASRHKRSLRPDASFVQGPSGCTIWQIIYIQFNLQYNTWFVLLEPLSPIKLCWLWLHLKGFSIEKCSNRKTRIIGASPTLTGLHCKTRVHVCMSACLLVAICRIFKLNERMWRISNLHTC